MARIAREHDWTEPRFNADGTVEVSILDFRGIAQRIVTVFPDGSTTVDPDEGRARPSS
jgi:hypothetical protein